MKIEIFFCLFNIFFCLFFWYFTFNISNTFYIFIRRPPNNAKKKNCVKSVSLWLKRILRLKENMKRKRDRGKWKRKWIEPKQFWNNFKRKKKGINVLNIIYIYIYWCIFLGCKNITRVNHLFFVFTIFLFFFFKNNFIV